MEIYRILNVGCVEGNYDLYIYLMDILWLFKIVFVKSFDNVVKCF